MSLRDIYSVCDIDLAKQHLMSQHYLSSCFIGLQSVCHCIYLYLYRPNHANLCRPRLNILNSLSYV